MITDTQRLIIERDIFKWFYSGDEQLLPEYYCLTKNECFNNCIIDDCLSRIKANNKTIDYLVKHDGYKTFKACDVLRRFNSQLEQQIVVSQYVLHLIRKNEK